MSDEEYRQEGINMQLKPIKDKIKALEEWKKTEEEQHQNITKALDNFVIDAGAIGDSVYSNKLKSLENEIVELKNKGASRLELIKSGTLISLKIVKESEINREDLRKTLKKLADVGISGFIDEELLEKLGSKPLDRQTVKKEKPYLDLGMITSKNGELSAYEPSQFIRDYAKTHTLFSLYGLVFPEEDSEALKDIKKLAKAENDFYDKHGYLSFWSDGLKAQRIKDSKPKQTDDAKQVEKLLNDMGCDVGISRVTLGPNLIKDPKQAEKKDCEKKHYCNQCSEYINNSLQGGKVYCKKGFNCFEHAKTLRSLYAYKEDSGSEKEDKELDVFYEHLKNKDPNLSKSDEKLPEPNIPIREKGGDVLFYDPCCTCKFEPANNQDLCSKICFVKTDGHRSAWEPKKKPPKSLCTLKEQEQCEEECSMDCLKGNSEGEYNNPDVCIHGKKELEKGG